MTRWKRWTIEKIIPSGRRYPLHVWFWTRSGATMFAATLDLNEGETIEVVRW